MDPYFPLNNLPVEVLSVLDQYLPVRSKLGLILSGDVRLVQRLKSGGVFSFSVRLQAPLKWPTHLFSFLCGVHVLRLDYQLDLFSYGVKVSFLSPITNWSPQLRALELHPLAGLTRASLLALPATLVSLKCSLLSEDLDACPSSLTSLCVACPIALTNATKFPSPNLEHLSLSLDLSQFNPRHCVHLPSTLTSLTLSAESEVDEVLALLPTSLTTLTLNTTASFDTSLLPRALTQTTFPLTTRMTESMIANLPEALLTLVMPNESSLDVHEYVRLPPHLTILNVNSNSRIKTETAALFPRTLTELWADNMDCYNNAPSVKHFPPNLKLFSMMGISTSRQIIPYLPRTITDIRMNIWTEASLTNDDISSLPPALTRLDLSASLYFSCDIILKLPPVLKTLIMDTTIDGMEDKHVASLPRTLTYLHLPRLLRLTSNSCSLFPKSLREMHILSVADTAFLNGSKEKQQLPPNCLVFQAEARII